jgi:hypothetical protein
MRRWMRKIVRRASLWVFAVIGYMAVPATSVGVLQFKLLGFTNLIIPSAITIIACRGGWVLISKIIRPELPWARQMKRHLRGATLVSATALLCLVFDLVSKMHE